jgi:putative spermidine/putrescine transport system permease protein
LVVIVVAAIAPLVMIFWVSFWRTDGLNLVRTVDTTAWATVLRDPTFYRLAWSSLQTVFIVLALVGVLGLAAGYFLARFVTNRKLQALLLMLAILPFWTSYLIRIITWQPLFGNSGVINFLLAKAGLPQMELFLFNQRAMIFAMTSLYVVFVIGPVFWALSRIDPEVIAASRSLGASAWTTFRTVELPLARGGLVVGLFFASIFLFGDYATGRLIGGGTNPLLSDAISQYAGSGQWPIAAVLAVVLFILAIVVLAIFMRVYDLRNEL